MELVHRSGAEETNLPDDVLIDIFCRLPIKTLIAFKWVCKSWLYLISQDTRFADSYRKRSPSELLLRSSYIDHTGFTITKLYLGNLQFHNHPLSDFNLTLLCGLAKSRPRSYISTTSVFANSCNGFVCFRSYPVFNSRKLMPVVICNPITGESINVSGTDLDYTTESSVGYGLGFSEKENRYKLLRLVYALKDHQKRELYPCSLRTPFAEICTLEKGSLWRNLGHCPLSNILSSSWPMIFLEGKLHFHWISDNAYIDCFDFDNEKFENVPLPDDHFGTHAINGTMRLPGESGNRLSLSCYGSMNLIVVWVMKIYGVKDSWTKLFSITTHVSCYCFKLESYLKQMANGEILLGTLNNQLVLYNPILDVTRRLDHRRIYREVIAYNPTPVRLKDAFAGYEGFAHGES